MSGRTVRTSGRSLLLRVAIVIVTTAAGAGTYLWWTTSAPGTSLKPTGAIQGQSSPLQPVRRDEPLTVTLYYPFDGSLATGPLAVKRQPGAQAQAREALAALLTDQRSSQAAVLKDVKLREFYLDASGTGYIDLEPNRQKDLRASAGEELLAVYAMVDTLTQNFEEIKQVMIILDGKEALTLAGHLDLSRKFTKRTDLVRQ